MFTLEGVFENMLANACIADDVKFVDGKRINTYQFDMHCKTAVVEAICLTYGQDVEVHKFEIVSYKLL